jgi:hypothetical protein
MMPIDNHINLLKNIQPVEPPPFLLAKIKHRIANKIPETIPFKWTLAFCIVGAMLILINVGILRQNNTPTTSGDIKDLVNNWQLSSNNTLYNE